MMDVSSVPMWAFYFALLILVVMFAYKLHAIMTAKDNPIEWWQFIASKASDGTLYADITKLGQVLGIILVVWLAIAMSARVVQLDWVGFCGILSLVLTYLGGVQVFQALMKSKQAQQPSDSPASDRKE